MKLNELISKLTALAAKNPELLEQHIFLWDEHGEKFIGFNNKCPRNKAYIEPDMINRNDLGEDEVFYTIRDAKDFLSNEHLTKADFKQVILL